MQVTSSIKPRVHATTYIPLQQYGRSDHSIAASSVLRFQLHWDGASGKRNYSEQISTSLLASVIRLLVNQDSISSIGVSSITYTRSFIKYIPLPFQCYLEFPSDWFGEQSVGVISQFYLEVPLLTSHSASELCAMISVAGKSPTIESLPAITWLTKVDPRISETKKSDSLIYYQNPRFNGTISSKKNIIFRYHGYQNSLSATIF